MHKGRKQEGPTVFTQGISHADLTPLIRNKTVTLNQILIRVLWSWNYVKLKKKIRFGSRLVNWFGRLDSADVILFVYFKREIVKQSNK